MPWPCRVRPGNALAPGFRPKRDAQRSHADYTRWYIRPRRRDTGHRDRRGSCPDVACVAPCRKLRLAQDLLRHRIPDGNPAEVFDRALSALLRELARKKLGATRRPRPGRGAAPGSRHIPAEVRRAVWMRDGGRCAFLAKSGLRCSERGFLEFHHAEPHAAGGEATARNISLRCRPHNGYEAELYFGARKPGAWTGQLVLERVAPPDATASSAAERRPPPGSSARGSP